jgi:hypothetical protein
MKTTAADAIIAVLRDINATPDKPIIMFEIGVPLVVEKGYSELDVLNGLDWLVSEKIIELPGNNTLRLMKHLG